MLTGIVKEVIKAGGGAVALARELKITRQGVYLWQQDGFPLSRLAEISRLTGVSRTRLEAFTNEKVNEKYRGKPYYEPAKRYGW
jgi:Bacterial toxin YdaS